MTHTLLRSFQITAVFLCWIAGNPSVSAQVVVIGGADTSESAALRGGGAFLRGAGSYNLNTAKAEAIQVNTVIQWKRELRKIESERRDLLSRKEAGKQLKIEEVKRRQQLRQQQLRLNPNAEDIQTGEALNILLFDLTDPDITSADWLAKVVQLPKGLSVKDLIFRFTPLSTSTDTSKALSRGVVALSLLEVAGDKWPDSLKAGALDNERRAYEAVYAKLRNQLLTDSLDLQIFGELDQSLKSLEAKAEKEIPENRGYRKNATTFVEDLKAATKLFDANAEEYAKEILRDTADQDATTVGELVSFMLKYRLQFASATRNPKATVLYRELFEVMRQQATSLGTKPPEVPVAGIVNGDFSNGLEGWTKEGETEHFVVFKGRENMAFTTGPGGHFKQVGRLYQSFIVPEKAEKLACFLHGSNSASTYVALRAGDGVIWKQSGPNRLNPDRYECDIKKLRGKKVTFEIVDQNRGTFGFIGVHGIRILP